MKRASFAHPIREVDFEELLGREPIDFGLPLVREKFFRKSVLVTGAAGSIGSEICRRLAVFQPSTLIAFDQAETPLFHLERELKSEFHDLPFQSEIGNITHVEDVSGVMRQHRPSIVIHAAAYKHVHLMERHVRVAVENNIFGTWNTAQAAAANGVDDFIFISTDKSVQPASVMGASKCAAEYILQAMQRERGTKFVSARFGNVLGSSGSVVPIFTDQIARGGPVTITDAAMERYLMTMREACQFVLTSLCLGESGGMFIPKLGQPERILDLAVRLIRLFGLEPGRDIQIEFTGARPGEKLSEQLYRFDEDLIPTIHPEIMKVVSAKSVGEKEVTAFLDDLQRAILARDLGGLIILLRQMVPDYTPDSSFSACALETH